MEQERNKEHGHLYQVLLYQQLQMEIQEMQRFLAYLKDLTFSDGRFKVHVQLVLIP